MILLLAASGLFAGTGCGGTAKSSSKSGTSLTAGSSDVEPASQSTPLDREGMRARANLICERIHAKRSATVERSPQDYRRKIPALAAYELQAVAAMRKLKPPVSMAPGWRQIVAASQALADATAKAGQYAQQNNFRVSRAAQATGVEAVAATERLEAVARREGFTECARI